MSRAARVIASSAAAVLLVLPATTTAAPSRSVRAVTTVADSYPAPQATVSSAWTVDADGSERLHSAGYNVAGAVSTVTASWTGTRRGDSQGRVLRLDRQYVYDAVREGATADISVEYRLRGVWYRMPHMRRDYVGTIGALRKQVTEQLVVRVPATRGKTVVMRVSVVLRFPEPCLNVDDVLVVRSSVA